MTIESRRKEIMSKSREWGEIVEPLPYTPYSPPRQKTDTPALPHGPLDSEDTIMNDRHGVGDQAREDRQLPDEMEDAPLHSDASCGLLDHTLAMTSTRGWSLDLLLETGPNFHGVHRVSATSPDLGDTIRNVFEVKGRPLVIEGFHQHPQWPKEMFTLEHFGNNMEKNGEVLPPGVREATHDPLLPKVSMCEMFTTGQIPKFHCSNLFPNVGLLDRTRRIMVCPSAFSRGLKLIFFS
jgi:hypothetical protein